MSMTNRKTVFGQDSLDSETVTSFNDICIGNIFRSKPIIGGKNRLFARWGLLTKFCCEKVEKSSWNWRKWSKICQKGLVYAHLGFSALRFSWLFPFGVSRLPSRESVNLKSDHTIVHNVYVDYDNQSTHSKLHRPSFICNDVINDVIKRREIRRPPERKELSPQVLKHRQRWLARINRIHRPFLTDRKPLR